MLLSVFPVSCVDPFDAPRGNYDELLVVDAFITDAEAPQHVYLSVSYPIDANTFRTVDNALVVISDDLGTTHELRPEGNGDYVSDPSVWRPVAGRIYTLSIDLGGQRRYVSAEVRMKPAPPIDRLYYEPAQVINEEGEIVNAFDILVDAAGLPGEPLYLRYEWEETYKTVPPFPSIFEYNRETGGIDLRTEQISECWVTNNSTSIITATNEGLNTSNINAKPIHTLRFDRSELNVRYSILVHQFALEKEAYEFWENLRETNEAGGGLFDTQPFPLTGNIRNTNDSREAVLGYFDMSEVATERLYIDSDDLPGETTVPSLFAECLSGAGEVLVQTDSVFFYDQQGFLISDYLFPQGYIMVPERCIDCRIKGSNVKPDFWVD